MLKDKDRPKGEHVKLRQMKRAELEDLARSAGTSYGYLLQIKYGFRRPSPELAKAIERASGGRINRLELLYPEETG